MKLKSSLKALLAALISIAIIVIANHFFGQFLTHAAVLVMMVFVLFFMLFSEKEKGKKDFKVVVKKMEVNAEGVQAFIQHIATPKSLSVVQKVNDFIQTPYADLDPEAQVMKSEENALRVRLIETLKFLDTDTFKQWPEGKKDLLRQQAGAMLLYHGTLVSRCYDAGVLVNPASSESSESVPAGSASGE